jgi:Fur family ferric uptake transcriptional regulator
MKEQRKIRMTRQREVILEELGMLHSHPTADEIYERVRSRLPRVSLGTVYRTLDLLSRSGLIGKIEIAGQQMRFDRELGAHQHIRCIRCGRIVDVPGERTPTECDRATLQATGYRLIERRVEFLGICPACRDAERSGRES